MKKGKFYFVLTLVISILVGIILPMVFGLRDIELIAVFFGFIWFIYVAGLFIWTFLIEGRRLKRDLEKNFFSRFDEKDNQALYEMAVKKLNKEQKKILWN